MRRPVFRAQGLQCRCFRCREPGRSATPEASSLELRSQVYEASGGKEHFLSWEDPATDTVAGFLRLRFPNARTDGGLKNPVVRELKVLGVEVPIDAPANGGSQYQHRGLGRSLLEAAEERSPGTWLRGIVRDERGRDPGVLPQARLRARRAVDDPSHISLTTASNGSAA